MKRSDLYHIPFSSLQIVDGFNVRQDYGDLESLSSSIEENGVKVPLRVFKEKGSELYNVVDGHRRLKAVELAIENGRLDPDEFLIPCIMEGKGSNAEDRVLGMLLYNDGKRLNLLEEGEVFKRLINYGWTEVKIAEKVGKTRTHVDNCLLLLSASPELKQKIVDGEVSSSFVIEELRDQTSDEVVENIEEAKKVTGAKKISKKHIDKVKKTAPKKTVRKEQPMTALKFLFDKGLLQKGSTQFLIVFDEDDERAGKDFDLVELLEEYSKVAV